MCDQTNPRNSVRASPILQTGTDVLVRMVGSRRVVQNLPVLVESRGRRNPMQHAHSVRSTWTLTLSRLTIVFLFFTATAFAKEKKKEYPESGKVIAVILNRVVSRYVYRVETETRIYELQCENSGLFSTPVCKRNGKPIALGDVLQFRIEKEWAYVPKESDSESEPRFRILSTAMKEPKQLNTGKKELEQKPAVPQ